MGTTEKLKNQLQQRGNQNQDSVGVTIKQLLNAPAMKKRFEDVLKDRAPLYMSSVLNLVNNDSYLQRCEPMTVIGSCMIAATLNLPVDKNLGYAWVIPYKDNKNGGIFKAQFQLGYKGYIQLALRTGQYRYINVIPVFEGELKRFNRLTEELEFDQDAKESDRVVGYAAYFELLNGFKKTVYWTADQVVAHRDRFSKQKDGKVWNDDFDAMAMKTVLKNMLAKWGILSVEMQRALADDDHTVQATEDGNTVTLAPEGYEVQDDAQTPTAASESGATLEPDQDDGDKE